jgi:hypothetical protein
MSQFSAHLDYAGGTLFMPKFMIRFQSEKKATAGDFHRNPHTAGRNNRHIGNNAYQLRQGGRRASDAHLKSPHSAPKPEF